METYIKSFILLVLVISLKKNYKAINIRYLLLIGSISYITIYEVVDKYVEITSSILQVLLIASIVYTIIGVIYIIIKR